ncbi:MAG TPA: hypothetical protein VFL53_08430 [Pseudolabrys sp.]|jgi:hypothetical protein|nr:hypothetical protein [Pseudolabrys sp.]
MTRVVTIITLAAFLGGSPAAAFGPEVPFGIAISAASKKSTSARRQETGQIACTVSGCQRIPPNCHPQAGYNWDGIPTGFDIVVCRAPRDRRG